METFGLLHLLAGTSALLLLELIRIEINKCKRD